MRLIDAHDLMERLYDANPKGRVELAELIETEPTVDAVEVVRCKDCRWYENDGFHTNCQIMRFCVEAEDYCSRGERRKDETD